MIKLRPALFKWRHFEPEIIVCAVRWYLRFSLSYVETLVTVEREAGDGDDGAAQIQSKALE